MISSLLDLKVKKVKEILGDEGMKKWVQTRRSGFTLLEILIALALVAILMVAAVPYMADAWKYNQSEKLSSSIEELVMQTRSQAITSGRTTFIPLNDINFLPKGWKLEVERFSDSEFRSPMPEELWQFSSEGICDPLSLRLLGGKEPLIMKFDPLTGQITHDEE